MGHQTAKLPVDIVSCGVIDWLLVDEVAGVINKYWNGSEDEMGSVAPIPLGPWITKNSSKDNKLWTKPNVKRF